MAALIFESDAQMFECIDQILPQGIELVLLRVKDVWYLYFREC